MKKFFSNVLLIISVLIVSLVAIPWNKLEQWGFELAFLTDNELIIKAAIGVFVIALAIVFFFVSNRNYNEEAIVSNNNRNLAVIPVFGYSLASMIFTAYISYSLYMNFIRSTAQLLLFVGSLGIIVTLFIIGYFLVMEYRKVKNIGRFFRMLILIEIAAGTALFGYLNLLYRAGNYYDQISSRYLIFVIPLFLILYVVYLIFSSKSQVTEVEEEKLEEEIKENKKQKVQKKIGKESKEPLVVSKEQSIVSRSQEMDPTAIVFQDVEVDPEFSKISNQANQANSIEYYIEKPKMFKPLNPSFDELVSYVRGLPQVVTKLDDDRITFYVDRKPFLVLMNFGNYYRLAFKYDLEQGIRLIIKYPTISKNKSTKDELWFKANNYGDLPKEVIYTIVKTAHNNYSS